jgi:hypothetical protein
VEDGNWVVPVQDCVQWWAFRISCVESSGAATRQMFNTNSISSIPTEVSRFMLNVWLSIQRTLQGRVAPLSTYITSPRL